MNRLTFKMMSALLAVLFAVSACSSNAATPTTTSNANPTAVPLAASAPTQAMPAATTVPTAMPTEMLMPTDVPTEASMPEPQVTTVVTQGQSGIDPCALVTQAEATQAVGAQVQAGLKNSKQYTAFAQGFGLGGATVSSCTYVGQSVGQLVNVIVFEFNNIAGNVAIQEAKAKLDQNPEATAISGLGDLAYGMPATVIVLKGTTAVAVNVLSSPQDLNAGKYDKAQALATVALTRLP